MTKTKLPKVKLVMTQSGHQVSVIILHDKINVGYFYVYIYRNFVHLVGLNIDIEYQGNKYGIAAIKKLRDDYKTIPSIELECVNDLEPYYAKIGFEIKKKRGWYVEMIWTRK